MWVTKKASETINRGITAVAMTVAIATIYAGMVAEGQVSRGDVLPHQIQTAFKTPALKKVPASQTLQTTQDAQESLATLVVGTQGNRYDYQ
ncbi:hypothetical protein IQ260_20335 [Leptolyngbya cf. ectocarpi LEGE 11479]|uniref:Uncharacterized protein n=1 Tax=Leptolyngbya cf. ectocarpi LEGE 11479 TaxID=1828722 RepID=A0A928ZWY2_LEPEC|nr:hypothetical protein [Leptolyngbya ectocarpi]MBE9068996.1 hypothetical protein [Leptolyngbya cf. ectocarpi LEGE 11479]